MRAAQSARAPFAALAACALALGVLAACDRAEETVAFVPSDDPAMDVSADTEADAEALFAALCREQAVEEAVCGCMRERVVTASGMRGLGYIGAAFGDDPASAAPYEAAMTQDARDVAAVAYLDAQYECVAGDDPSFAPPAPPPADAIPAESPLEDAVTVCVDYGVAEEPLCRCRAEAVLEALGEEGLALVQADSQGDQAAVQALANLHGAQWLNDGLGAMAGARTQCGL